MESKPPNAFAIWITGLPASGKSALTAALKKRLLLRDIDVGVLESDDLRKILTPRAEYGEEERETFYFQITYIGTLLVKHGVPVIFDATANLRRYRDAARARIAPFIEVYVDTPLEVCRSRDPKGIYRAAGEGKARSVPGTQVPYEPPEHPEIVVHGAVETPEASAEQVMAKLAELGLLGA